MYERWQVATTAKYYDLTIYHAIEKLRKEKVRRKHNL